MLFTKDTESSSNIFFVLLYIFTEFICYRIIPLGMMFRPLPEYLFFRLGEPKDRLRGIG